MRLVVTAARSDTLAERWLSETWTPEPPVADQWREVIFNDAGEAARRRGSSGGRRSPPARESKAPR